jgi:hypothetical protein
MLVRRHGRIGEGMSSASADLRLDYGMSTQGRQPERMQSAQKPNAAGLSSTG